jgi:shikimate dehydrogenase
MGLYSGKPKCLAAVAAADANRRPQQETHVSDLPVLVGLLGAGIGGSLAPQLHMQEGAELGLRYIYRLIDFAAQGMTERDLGDVLTFAERLGFDGMAVTVPFKQAIMPLLTALSDDARELNAVNTVVLKGGARIGHNTDQLGFADAFRSHFPHAQAASAVQMGAGGAGSAVAFAALKSGLATLTIFDVDRDRAAALVDRLRQRFGRDRVTVGDDLPRALAAADGLINATPVGMDTCPGSPVPVGLLRANLWVADIIYFPAETALLAAARAHGAATMNGSSMFVSQAAEQVRLFTGQEPDLPRMSRHFARIRHDTPDIPKQPVGENQL